MKNFIFKSTDADLQKMFQSIETIEKNVLYCTYRLDLVVKKVNALGNDNNLQKQVDDYFDEDNQQNIPEEDKEPDWALQLHSLEKALDKHSGIRSERLIYKMMLSKQFCKLLQLVISLEEAESAEYDMVLQAEQ